jgi:hypothetical protein
MACPESSGEDPKSVVSQVLIGLVHFIIIKSYFSDEREELFEFSSFGHVGEDFGHNFSQVKDNFVA